jgi:hypothetical protein
LNGALRLDVIAGSTSLPARRHCRLDVIAGTAFLRPDVIDELTSLTS